MTALHCPQVRSKLPDCVIQFPSALFPDSSLFSASSQVFSTLQGLQRTCSLLFPYLEAFVLVIPEVISLLDCSICSQPPYPPPAKSYLGSMLTLDALLLQRASFTRGPSHSDHHRHVSGVRATPSHGFQPHVLSSQWVLITLHFN